MWREGEVETRAGVKLAAKLVVNWPHSRSDATTSHHVRRSNSMKYYEDCLVVSDAREMMDVILSANEEASAAVCGLIVIPLITYCLKAFC